MKRSNRLVLLIGIFLALVAFVLILLTIGNNNGGTKTPEEATTTTLVVATRDVDLGATFKDSDVKQTEVAITDFPANGIKLTSLVVGQIARAKVTSGQAVTTDVLNGASGQIQNIDVPPGYVAMAVQVDQVTGVGTIIKAGDYVDVVSGVTGLDKVPLVVAPVPRAPAASAKPGVTPAPRGLSPLTLPYNPTTVKTLVQGVQVLGTLLPPPTDNGSNNNSASPAPGSGSTTLNGQQQIVILAVTSQDVEVIKFNQIDGNISLVLRATADCKVPDASASPSPTPSPTPSPSSLLPGASASAGPTGPCPVTPTTGITLRRLVDDFGVLPPAVVEVIEPTPYPQVPR